MSNAWNGIPENPERDGWHWLQHPEDSRLMAVPWTAELQGWVSGSLHSPQGIVDLGYRYAGPCLTPAEVAERICMSNQTTKAALDTASKALCATLGDNKDPLLVAYSSLVAAIAAAFLHALPVLRAYEDKLGPADVNHVWLNALADAIRQIAESQYND